MISRGFKVGDIVEGRVTELKEFGAFIELSSGVDGFLHVDRFPEASNFSIGDILRVRIIRITPSGAINVTIEP